MFKNEHSIENNSFLQNEIRNFWLDRWDYITLYDAILEAREAGYTKGYIRELKAIYNSIEQYQ